MKEMSANLLLYPQCSSLVRPSVETTKEEFISTPLTPRHHSTRGQIARLSLRNTEDYMLMTATTTTVTLTMDDSAAGGNTCESSHLKKKRKEGLNPAKVLVVGKLHYGRRPEVRVAGTRMRSRRKKNWRRWKKKKLSRGLKGVLTISTPALQCVLALGCRRRARELCHSMLRDRAE